MFYTCCCFLHGFNKEFFEGKYYCTHYHYSSDTCDPSSTDDFNFLMKDNPILGNNTFGQLAAYGPERCYVMHRKLELLTVELCNLNSSGSESTSFPAFNKFYKALQGLHEGEDESGWGRVVARDEQIERGSVVMGAAVHEGFVVRRRAEVDTADIS